MHLPNTLLKSAPSFYLLKNTFPSSSSSSLLVLFLHRKKRKEKKKKRTTTSRVRRVQMASPHADIHLSAAGFCYYSRTGTLFLFVCLLKKMNSFVQIWLFFYYYPRSQDIPPLRHTVQRSRTIRDSLAHFYIESYTSIKILMISPSEKQCRENYFECDRHGPGAGFFFSSWAWREVRVSELPHWKITKFR